MCFCVQVNLWSSRHGMEGERYFWKDSVYELRWLQAQIRHCGICQSLQSKGISHKGCEVLKLVNYCAPRRKLSSNRLFRLRHHWKFRSTCQNAKLFDN